MTGLVFSLLGVFLASSTPVFVSLAFVAFIIFFFYGTISLEILPQRMFAGIEGFSLLAIPFFILAADLMGKGGLTARLARLVNAFVGHFPGGLAICVVMTCCLFGAITGSSAATVAAVGGILYPTLLNAGYDVRFSLGVVTCSALLGMIIPPSNAMIIYGSVSKVSVGALFMAGIGAGLLFSLNYAIYCYFYAKKKKIPVQIRATWTEIKAALKDSLWGLGMPVIILGGIYSGVFTPTESAAVSVAYAMFVSRFIYKELTFKQIWKIGLDSAITSSRILIMVSAAYLFSWLLTFQGITASIVEPVIDMKPAYWLVMAFSNLALLVAGCVVDTLSNILILCPLLLRLTHSVSISELHFGIVATVNADIGNITPPFGLNLFVAIGAFHASYVDVVRAVLPWLVIAIISLLIITYVPVISLWLPKQLYPGILF